MFRLDDKSIVEKQVKSAETNYMIQKNDFLQLEVFTNQGEKIIDPNQESFRKTGDAMSTENAERAYLVDVLGLVKLPLIGEVKLAGLTIKQAEEILQKEYGKFFLEPFIVLKFSNKRVIVLGAPGGQVIPLANENMRLTEVLALAKGLNNDARANNIRILRDDKIILADLSTIDGYLKNNYLMQSGDIVYVEPIRRSFSEGLRDYGPVISIITSVGTLIIVIIQITRN